MTFSATWRSSRVSRARYTWPIPPAPIAPTTSYGPSRAPADRNMEPGRTEYTSAADPFVGCLLAERLGGTRVCDRAGGSIDSHHTEAEKDGRGRDARPHIVFAHAGELVRQQPPETEARPPAEG